MSTSAQGELRGWRGRSGRYAAPLSCERGQAMAEAALTFPLLIMVMVGLLQFALYTHAQQVVTGAVQDGARAAAAVDRTVDDGVTHARAILQAGLGRSAEDIRLQATDNGEVVVVQAEGRLRALIPWAADASLPLHARSLVSKERFRARG